MITLMQVDGKILGTGYWDTGKILDWSANVAVDRKPCTVLQSVDYVSHVM